MCRWLLMMHDRAEGELLTYTTSFGDILGANRKSVTLAAHPCSLPASSATAGDHSVLNRLGLEKASCECYAVVK